MIKHRIRFQRRLWFCSALLGMALISFELPGQAKQAQKPNIVLILVDDLGWADLGCYGNKDIDTPNLDSLAAGGMRFTDAYSPAPICSASRAALLTGKSPARLQFEFVSKPDNSPVPSGTLLAQPDYPRDLPLRERTLAELLTPRGYRTGFFGKWHLTQENETYLGWGDTLGPLQQGFDQGSEHRGSHPYGYTRDETNSFGHYEEGEFPVDSLTGEAIEFLKLNREEPFLLYYSMYYVHTPVHTPCRWLYDKYRGRYGPEADENRVQYAAFVETMDAYAGRLLRALEGLKLAQNTAVFFLSDNGGHPHFTDNGPLKGSKWTLYEGGIRTPMIVRWPGFVDPGTTCGVPVIGTDLYPTVGNITGSAVRDDVDGIDLVPLLKGDRRRGPVIQRSLYWHFPFYHPKFVDTRPQSAIRDGRYKLIYFYETRKVELYDIAADVAEEHDLSHAMPRRAAQLKDKLMTKLAGAGARLPAKTIAGGD